MQLHVTPSAPTAAIPDPDRGDNLPAEGRAVTWTPYWAGRLARQEITAKRIAPEAAEIGTAEPAPKA